MISKNFLPPREIALLSFSETLSEIKSLLGGRVEFYFISSCNRVELAYYNKLVEQKESQMKQALAKVKKNAKGCKRISSFSHDRATYEVGFSNGNRHGEFYLSLKGGARKLGINFFDVPKSILELYEASIPSPSYTLSVFLFGEDGSDGNSDRLCEAILSAVKPAKL